MNEDHNTFVQECLHRLHNGDELARNELINFACERFRQLTRTMLKDYQRLKRWEETDDVLQNAMVRLSRALQQILPPSPRDFYRLATLQIRRELLDLSRHHFGPQGRAAKHATNLGQQGSSESIVPDHEPCDSSWDPSGLANWTEFHEQTGKLSQDEREVFELIWYQGMTHAEAANLLNVSVKTVQRRWHGACLNLHSALGGHLPGT